jgi:hypothetical protein
VRKVRFVPEADSAPPRTGTTEAAQSRDRKGPLHDVLSVPLNAPSALWETSQLES